MEFQPWRKIFQVSRSYIAGGDMWVRVVYNTFLFSTLQQHKLMHMPIRTPNARLYLPYLKSFFETQYRPVSYHRGTGGYCMYYGCTWKWPRIRLKSCPSTRKFKLVLPHASAWACTVIIKLLRKCGTVRKLPSLWSAVFSGQIDLEPPITKITAP